MGHMVMLHLKWKSFSLLKSLIEINLSQITIDSLVFCLNGSTAIAFAFAPFGQRSNLLWNCSMTSRRKIVVPRDTVDSFVKKFAFGLLRELLHSTEALEHWASGTLTALSAKEWNLTATETNTLLILNIDFAIENETQTQQTKYSVTGVFCSSLDLKTAGETPPLAVFVEIFVWCMRFSFVGLNRARNFRFFFATWVRCITTLGRACWR